MKKLSQLIYITTLSILIAACGNQTEQQRPMSSTMHGEIEMEVPVEKGPHGGRMLKDGKFAIELAIFETGVPPEFRVWVTESGTPIAPEKINLQVSLIRLGNKIDEINFRPQGDFLRGDTVIYEPHSFVVSIEANHNAKTYTWQYDNFEGRTKILPEIAQAFELETSIAGPQNLEEVITVYGQVVANPEKVSEVSARFDGVIQTIHVSIGDFIRKGQVLAKVESNESLSVYTIRAPISGVITARKANAGEQTDGRRLFTIMDTSSVWANLLVFPADRSRVQKGATVTVTPATGGNSLEGTISQINIMTDINQAVIARVELDNANGQLPPGTHVTGRVKVADYIVPLAVKRSGLQSFRDFTVVYAQIEDEYEVRMLDLGRQDHEWIEVLGGLEAGTHYVSKNSYLVKADIEKSGASHDH
jgi:cobalt-zinc-cadmium efflux system membrane fusion protein